MEHAGRNASPSKPAGNNGGRRSPSSPNKSIANHFPHTLVELLVASGIAEQQCQHLSAVLASHDVTLDVLLCSADAKVQPLLEDVGFVERDAQAIALCLSNLRAK